MTWLMTGRCGPSVDDVDDDSAPTCRMTWLSSQARIPALSGFSDFRQISGKTSARSTGLVSTPISTIFISPDSYGREESPQLVKSKI